MNWKRLTLAGVASRFFISYRSLNRPLAEALAARLTGAGQQVWLDRSNLYLGDQWAQEIRIALEDCDDVIVLLTREVVETPDLPDQRNQVLCEIEIAAELDKRILCFSTIDVRRYPGFYRLLEDKNYVELPDEVTSSLATAPDGAARYMAEQILQPVSPAHPANLRDFERMSVRSVFPDFGDIIQNGSIRTDLLSAYASHAGHLLGRPHRANALLLLNAALIAAHLKNWDHAFNWFEQSLAASRDPLTMYYYACALMRQIRPQHMPRASLDLCTGLLQEAWRQHQSPLIAIALVAILWDSNKGRGAKAQQLFLEALENLAGVQEESGEILRFLWFTPLEKDMVLPVDARQCRDYLLQLC